MKRYAFIALTLLAVISSGCAVLGGSRSVAPEVYTEAMPPAIAESDMAGAGFESPVMSNEGYASTGTEAVAAERMVTFTVNMSIVVADPAQSVKDIGHMAEEMGGFVVSSNTYESFYGEAEVKAVNGSITIRVPEERMEEALTEIKSNALEVRTENVSGQDVTQEYTDLTSQLSNLEYAEQQLREIMASATKTEDVLAIFQQLRQVRGEIEVLKGRMEYLEESVALSSISVELIPDVAAQPLQIGRWQPQGTAKVAVEALIKALQFLVDVIIWAGICILPVAAIIGVPVYFIVRAIVRRRRAAKAAAGKS